MKTIRLMAIDGYLNFPQGGMDLDAVNVEDVYGREDKPSILLRRYSTGDVDTIPWPWAHDYTERLAYALFDERECNRFFPTGAVIELPDGTPFDFDRYVA
jgi:hypothetical protein